MHALVRDAMREAALASLFLLPRARRRAIDRWLRGREEQRKLELTDHVLMSWGKSGRTWLRVMLSRFYQVAHGVPDGRMLEFDNLHRMDKAIPRLFFTHGNYLRDYTGNWTDKREFRAKKVVMLVRDPRDIAVSQYYQWKYRMRPVKKYLNDYPEDGAEVSLLDFVMNPKCGLPTILEFLEIWQQELPQCAGAEVVRYEDMRADPAGALGRVLAFLGTPGTDAQIQAAVDYAAYDNMKRLEQKQVFWLSGLRLKPGDQKNPQSYKVRRAKVGGHRDDFDPDQLARIDALVAARPCFGYGAPAPVQRSA